MSNHESPSPEPEGAAPEPAYNPDVIEIWPGVQQTTREKTQVWFDHAKNMVTGVQNLLAEAPKVFRTQG